MLVRGLEKQTARTAASMRVIGEGAPGIPEPRSDSGPSACHPLGAPMPTTFGAPRAACVSLLWRPLARGQRRGVAPTTIDRGGVRSTPGPRDGAKRRPRRAGTTRRRGAAALAREAARRRTEAPTATRASPLGAPCQPRMIPQGRALRGAMQPMTPFSIGRRLASPHVCVCTRHSQSEQNRTSSLEQSRAFSLVFTRLLSELGGCAMGVFLISAITTDMGQYALRKTHRAMLFRRRTLSDQVDARDSAR